MNPARVTARGLAFTRCLPARVNDLRLVFDKTSRDHPHHAHANLVFARGASTEGVLYELVDADEILKGFEYEKGSYVLLQPDEVDAVKLESKKTLELTQFVDAHEIDVLYFETPYYVVPADDLAEEAFVVLREALRRTKKVGLGQITLRGREYVVSLKPCARGMVLETLRYADEVNKAASYFRDIGDAKPDPDLLDMASALIERKVSEFDAKEFHNRYVDALKKLIAEKQRKKGEKVIQDPDTGKPDKGSNVIDLMAALKKSLGENEDKPAKKPVALKSSTKTAPRRTAKKAPAKRAAGGRR